MKTSDDIMAALHYAVTISKERQLKSASRLRTAMLDAGWKSEVVDEAIRHWVNYVARR